MSGSMTAANRWWVAIAVATFCIGIAIGRLSISNRAAATGPATAKNSGSVARNDVASSRDVSGATKPNTSDASSEPVEAKADIYSRIKNVLEANGTARL